MSSRRQRSIPLGGRYKQVSLYLVQRFKTQSFGPICDQMLSKKQCNILLQAEIYSISIICIFLQWCKTISQRQEMQISNTSGIFSAWSLDSIVILAIVQYLVLYSCSHQVGNSKLSRYIHNPLRMLWYFWVKTKKLIFAYIKVVDEI